MSKSKLKVRSEIIEYIYSHLVLHKKLSSTVAFESGDFSAPQIATIDEISANFTSYKLAIEQFLRQS